MQLLEAIEKIKFRGHQTMQLLFTLYMSLTQYKKLTVYLTSYNLILGDGNFISMKLPSLIS